MRPDTEPNHHAKRIMAGAAVLTAGLTITHAVLWTTDHYPTLATGVGIIVMATVVCYVIGATLIDAPEAKT